MFNGPTGITVDGSYNVYVCDTGNATIRKITSAGVVTTIAGSAGSRGSQDGTGSAALFTTPTGIAIDSVGTLYVSDSTSCTIRRITSVGVVTTFAGAARSSGEVDGFGAAARFNNPTGLTIDIVDNLYVADTYNDTIRKITASGITVTATAVGTIVGAGNAKVVFTDAKLAGSPITLSVPVLSGDAPADWATKVVTALQANTVISGSYSSGSNGASIIVTSFTSDLSDTTLNVALANDTCTGITDAPTSVATLPSVVVTTLAGSPGISGAYDGTGSYALFNLPQGVGADGNANIYVADTGNNCIRKITPQGVVTTVAGIAGIAGSKDSTSGTALFNQPQALNFANAVIVADTGNSLIRRINSVSAVDTIPLKTPGATPTPTPTPTPSPSTGYGSGSVDPWFAGVLLALLGLAGARSRRERHP